uniref:Intraflagellar transport protein 57 n=1 Tax=Lygus hesperus TaxID=30085 RepID=A0A0A9W1J6_LYGHE
MELALDRVEEDMAIDDDSDFDEDNELDVDDLYLSNAYIETVKINEAVENDVTAEAWQLELERVMPLLKVSIKSNSGDWRSHLEMMKTHQAGLSEISTLVTSNLGKISTDIENVMQKMGKREKLINSQFDLMLTQYRAFQDELAAVNERYREVNVGVVERQKTLNSISDNLETVKQEMDERGATMSDGSPLVHIKKAVKDIKKEIFEMDINIAVAEHIIVESKLRDKSLESHLIRSSGMT